MWEVDRIPTGPGIVKRHGALDVNWDAPALAGTPGTPGRGVPKGGTTGQALVKKTNTDHDTEWADVGGGNNIDGGRPDTVYTPIPNVDGGTP